MVAHLRTIGVALLTLLFFVAPSRGQSISLVLSVPSGDCYYGDGLGATASVTGLPANMSVVRYEWLHTCVTSNTVVGWDEGQSTFNAPLLETIADYKIQARAKIHNNDTNTDFYITSTEKSYVVKPPDTVELIRAPNDPIGADTPIVNPPGSPNLLVQFVVKGGGRHLLISPPIQEKLTRSKYPPPTAADMDWAEAPYLSLFDGIILDGKGIMATNEDWAMIADNARLDEFDQQFAVILPIPGGTKRFELQPVFHFKMSKLTGQNWELTMP